MFKGKRIAMSETSYIPKSSRACAQGLEHADTSLHSLCSHEVSWHLLSYSTACTAQPIVRSLPIAALAAFSTFLLLPLDNRGWLLSLLSMSTTVRLVSGAPCIRWVAGSALMRRNSSSGLGSCLEKSGAGSARTSSPHVHAGAC